VSRRTETAYKAESLGKAAQHVKAQGSGDTVNGAVVQRKFTSLSGEACPECVRLSEARYVATRGVMRQESAEAIVGVGSCHGRRNSRKRALRREKKAGRTHPAEGPNTKK
jgi:hypothetical protein